MEDATNVPKFSNDLEYDQKKIMSNDIKANNKLGNTELEYVEQYTYLDQIVSFTNKEDEVLKRRILVGLEKIL